MLVPLPEPFSFELTTERYRTFGRDPANLWRAGRLHRVIGGRERVLEPAPRGVRVTPAAKTVVADVRRLFGAPFDLPAFEAVAQGDAVLRALVRRLRGLRPSLAPDPFEALVGSICAQQVSLHAAFAIRARLVERFGVRHEQAWAFPTRERIAAASADELRALGFSARKAEYVVALARAELDLGALGRRADEEVRARLTALPGLGDWTVDWFLARHLGRPDAWPAGDLGLRKAVSAFYFDGGTVSEREVRAFGERFSPHRNLAAHYLLVGLRVRTVSPA